MFSIRLITVLIQDNQRFTGLPRPIHLERNPGEPIARFCPTLNHQLLLAQSCPYQNDMMTSSCCRSVGSTTASRCSSHCRQLRPFIFTDLMAVPKGARTNRSTLSGSLRTASKPTEQQAAKGLCKLPAVSSLRPHLCKI